MEMSRNLAGVFASVKPYERRTAVAPVGKHQYLMGLQHRPTGDGERYWTPDKASVLYFLQNEAGAARWPVKEHIVEHLLLWFDVERSSELDLD